EKTGTGKHPNPGENPNKTTNTRGSKMNLIRCYNDTLRIQDQDPHEKSMAPSVPGGQGHGCKFEKGFYFTGRTPVLLYSIYMLKARSNSFPINSSVILPCFERTNSVKSSNNFLFILNSSPFISIINVSGCILNLHLKTFLRKIKNRIISKMETIANQVQAIYQSLGCKKFIDNKNYSLSSGTTITTHLPATLSNSQTRLSPSFKPSWCLIAAGTVVRKLRPSLPEAVNLVLCPLILLIYNLCIHIILTISHKVIPKIYILFYPKVTTMKFKKCGW
ncbi:MAG: hypothetical protein ABFC12_05965, partial [Methanobacterium sp.]